MCVVGLVSRLALYQIRNHLCWHSLVLAVCKDEHGPDSVADFPGHIREWALEKPRQTANTSPGIGEAGDDLVQIE